MLISGTLVATDVISFVVAVSVTKLRSHSTYERADCVAHNPDICA
jgi:hypothetical protein